MAKKNGRKDERKTKLVPQPGGGALWSHGPPPETQVAGPGRPPSRIREELRGDFDSRKHVLRDIADGVVPLFRERCPDCGYEPEHDAKDLPELIARPADRSKALDLMGKYGLGDKGIDEEFVRELATEVATVLKPTDDGDALLAAIHERWKPIIGRRL